MNSIILIPQTTAGILTISTLTYKLSSQSTISPRRSPCAVLKRGIKVFPLMKHRCLSRCES